MLYLTIVYYKVPPEFIIPFLFHLSHLDISYIEFVEHDYSEMWQQRNADISP